MIYFLTLITWLALSLPAAGSVFVDVVPFGMLTSATTQTITGDMGGQLPKGGLFIVTKALTPGTIRANTGLTIGAHTTGSSWYVMGQSFDNQTVTDADSWQDDNAVVAVQNLDRTLMCAGTTTGFVADGIPLAQTAGCTQEFQGAALLFGGTDTTCKAATFTAPSGIGSSTDVNDVGFTPDIVFIAKSKMDTFTAAGGASQIVDLGIAVNHPVAADVNAGVSWVVQNGQNPSAVGVYVSTTTLYTLDVFTGDGEYTISFDAAGFNVLQGVEANADMFGYLACKFNNKAQFYLSVVDTSATANNAAHSFTGPGFLPLLSMLLMTGANTANSIEVTAGAAEDPGSLGISLLHGSSIWSGSVSAQDNASPSAMKSLVSLTDLRMMLHTGLLGWQCTPAHISTGLSLPCTTNPSTARKWVYLAMKTTATRRRAPGNN
jgi:hypothetical protein